MAEIEKVIKGFECCHIMVHDMGPDNTSCGICPYKNVQTEEQINLGGIECIAALHDDALELLKGQEAVEPSFKHGEDGIFVWCCGSCGAYMYHIYDGIDKAKEYAKYCRQCGKPVKWAES